MSSELLFRRIPHQHFCKEYEMLAWPFAYLAARGYLGMFLQHISLTFAPFILSLVIILLIAWAAVTGQAFRAARVTPAQVLRYE